MRFMYFLIKYQKHVSRKRAKTQASPQVTSGEESDGENLYYKTGVSKKQRCTGAGRTTAGAGRMAVKESAREEGVFNKMALMVS